MRLLWRCIFGGSMRRAHCPPQPPKINSLRVKVKSKTGVTPASPINIYKVDSHRLATQVGE